MTIDSLIEKLEQRLDLQHPFVCYSLPDSNQLTAIFQTDEKLYDASVVDDTVFLMAAFDNHHEKLCIPRDKAELFECTYELTSPIGDPLEIQDTEDEKVRHMNLVANAIETIEREECEKIVVSRKKEILLQSFEISALLKNLLSFYPAAFRYVWYHPNTGLWCGATPEVLLISEGNTFQSMALAGTQKIVNDQLRTWSQKEILEQNLVAQVMAQRLQKITSVLRISKRYTHRAGSVAHIRTDLDGFFKKSRFTQNDLAEVLHPTPAVCGTPSENAMQFIRDNEGYDRTYYTGYLGPTNIQKEVSNLFVNLRCMNIVDRRASLFVGGGITANSELESEWEETQHKLQTMAKVIQPFL